MIYLGRCRGVSPPTCAPCCGGLPACCARFADESRYASDAFEPIGTTVEDAFLWCGAMTPRGEAIDPERVLIDLTGIACTVEIPAVVTAGTVCGVHRDATMAEGEDFSGLTVSLSGNSLTISGAVTVLGVNDPTTSGVGLTTAGFSVGVVCDFGGVPVLVQVWFVATDYINPDHLEYYEITPWGCSPPATCPASALDLFTASATAVIQASPPECLAAGTAGDSILELLDGGVIPEAYRPCLAWDTASAYAVTIPLEVDTDVGSVTVSATVAQTAGGAMAVSVDWTPSLSTAFDPCQTATTTAEVVSDTIDSGGRALRIRLLLEWGVQRETGDCVAGTCSDGDYGIATLTVQARGILEWP